MMPMLLTGWGPDVGGGSPVFPTAGNVRAPIQYGPNGTDYTGTLTLPAVANVLYPIQYGAAGTEFTGTYGQPSGGSGGGAESILLRSVRQVLQAALSVNGTKVNIELDEKTPATAANQYVAIVPGGYKIGPIHDPSGGVYDFIYSLEVYVVRRMTNVPRDREREPFLFFSEAVALVCETIIDAIDYRYDLMGICNSLIDTEMPGEEHFIQPLMFQNIEPKPRIIPAEVFGAKKDERAGLSRRIYFSECRRITRRTLV